MQISWTLFFSTLILRGQAAGETIPSPIVIEPSQYWDGNDGPWSSLHLEVGTPPQGLRVLPDTATQETWVVLPQGCKQTGPDDCPTQRGGIFNTNFSATWVPSTLIWNNTGYYALGNYISDLLGIAGAGQYGFDTVRLGFNGRSVVGSIVAGIVTKSYWVGHFGLSPRPTNFTVENNNSTALSDPQTSLFSLLKSNDVIPSLAYGLSVGSFYRSKSVKNALCSLIFGGFDSSKLVDNQLEFSFGPDDGRELIVSLGRVAVSMDNAAEEELLPSPIIAALDSTQPNIWLPLDACRNFEKTFGLEWNATSEYYFVNDSWHNDLLGRDASLTFQLGESSKGAQVNISIPYGAFDLTLSYPAVSRDTRYFPLKRAKNETQYTLGRAFLQEAYLIANYDNRTFRVFQAKWEGDGPNVVPITPTSSGIPISDDPKSPGPSLPRKEKIAIIIGSVLGGVLLIVVVFWLFVRRRQRRDTASLFSDKEVGARPVTPFQEAPDTAIEPGELEGGATIAEVKGEALERVELPTNEI